jgi:hypothetical protein
MQTGRSTLLRVRLGAFFFALYGDAQGAEKMEIVRRECAALAILLGGSGVLGLFGGDLVQADCGFKHQQHVKAVLADILHHPSDLFALDDRLMDGLAQLLNKFAQTRCHEYLHERRPVRMNRGRGIRFIYLTSVTVWEQLRRQAKTVQSRSGSVAATIITE